jgi:acylphosphatase
MMKSTKIIVHGNVQGVYFRNNLRREAFQVDAKGFAENLPNGDVLVVIQGSENAVRDMIKFIRSSPGRSEIKDINVTEEDLPECKEFAIR